MTLTNGRHDEAWRRRTRAAFVEMQGEAAAERRAAEIAALPSVEWKGRRLVTVRCHATTGKGPHDINVPEAVLWSLLAIAAFKCPYHA